MQLVLNELHLRLEMVLWLARLHKELNHHFWVSLLLMKCRGLNFQEPGVRVSWLIFTWNCRFHGGIYGFCGNHPLTRRWQRKWELPKWAESGGYMKIKNVRYDSQDWQSFIHYLWPLQWTNVETPLNDELNEKLFILSKGNIGLAQMIYRGHN